MSEKLAAWESEHLLRYFRGQSIRKYYYSCHFSYEPTENFPCNHRLIRNFGKSRFDQVVEPHAWLTKVFLDILIPNALTL